MLHNNVTKNLSAYVDLQLPEEKVQQVARHLASCRACRQRLLEVQQGKRLAAQFKAPEWKGAEAVWQKVHQATVLDNSKRNLRTYARHPRDRRLSSLNWKPVFATAMIICLAILNLLLTFRNDRHPYELAQVDRRAAYAFDFGLLLDALAAGSSPLEFERRYDSQTSSYEHAGAQLPFQLASFANVPQPFLLQEVRLLKNACCRSVQFICLQQQSCIMIFQLLKGHPITFGNYSLERGRLNDRDVHKVKAGTWTVISWEEQNSRFIAVGEINEDDLATIVRRVKTI